MSTYFKFLKSEPKKEVAHRKCWSQDVKNSLNMFHHWLLTCKILLMRLLLDMISAELYRLCHGRVQVTFHIHPLGGEHGPTDYIHNVVLPCCRVLHQSCTQAFIIIFTWESTESRIWSTIIPAQVLVLKRRYNLHRRPGLKYLHCTLKLQRRKRWLL